MKKTFKVAVIAVLAFVLTGCMRMHVELTLHEDNTADGTMIMAFSDEFAASMGMTPEDLMAGMGEDLETPDGATTVPYKEDGYTGTKSTFANTPIEFATGGQEMNIERIGDEFIISGEMDMSDQGMGAGTGDPAGDAAAQAMLEGLDMAFKITFPGPVSSHNGTLDGNTVTWKMVPGEPLVFDARGSAIPGKGAAPAPSEEPSGESSQTPGEEGTESGTEPSGEESEKPAEKPAEEDESSNLPLILGIGGGVLLLLIIGTIVILANKKKKAGAQDQANAFVGAPGAPGSFGQNGFQQQGYQQPGGYQPQGYQQPGAYDPNAQQGYQQPGGYQPQGYQQPGAYDPNVQQGYQQPGAYQPPADQGFQQQGYQQPGAYDPNAQQGYQQPGGYQPPADQGYQQPPVADGWSPQEQVPPTQQFPQPPVDPQNPQNPQQ